MKDFDIGIFIFRRDLRLDDNIGLINLLKNCNKVIPIFILDKYQIIKSDHNNYYFSNNAVQFMCESLEDLNDHLKKYSSKLHLFFGTPHLIIDNILKKLKGNIALSYNKDYSKYSLERDQLISNTCNKNNVTLIECESDFTLLPFDKLIKKDGDAFKQYGAFYKNSKKNNPTNSQKNKYTNYKTEKFDNLFTDNLNKFYKNNPNILSSMKGGRTQALQILTSINQFKKYNDNRNFLSYNTTNLSAALNFGCISIREAHDAFKKNLDTNNELIKQLYWRDFFLCIAKYSPLATDFKHHMDPRYDNITWKNNKKDWETLWYAKTGFLLIDAAMNQMHTTGYLHGRARMLVGVMWIKYLLINPICKPILRCCNPSFPKRILLLAAFILKLVLLYPPLPALWLNKLTPIPQSLFNNISPDTPIVVNGLVIVVH